MQEAKCDCNSNIRAGVRPEVPFIRYVSPTGGSLPEERFTYDKYYCYFPTRLKDLNNWEYLQYLKRKKDFPVQERPRPGMEKGGSSHRGGKAEHISSCRDNLGQEYPHQELSEGPHALAAAPSALGVPLHPSSTHSWADDLLSWHSGSHVQVSVNSGPTLHHSPIATRTTSHTSAAWATSLHYSAPKPVTSMALHLEGHPGPSSCSHHKGWPNPCPKPS